MTTSKELWDENNALREQVKGLLERCETTERLYVARGSLLQEARNGAEKRLEALSAQQELNSYLQAKLSGAQGAISEPGTRFQ